MDQPLNHYWNIRLADLKSALETNNFEVHIAETAADAQKIVLDILAKTGARSVSWGGSVTVVGTGLYKAVKERADLEMIDTLEKGVFSFTWRADQAARTRGAKALRAWLAEEGASLDEPTEMEHLITWRRYTLPG